jgi:hypothetical protein
LIVWLAPGALHAVGGGNHHGFVVSFGGVLVHGGGGLGAEVSGFGVEVEGADAVRAMSTDESHAALDPFDAIGFH